MLLEKNKSLSNELTELQEKHSELTVSLSNQKTQREELMTSQQRTEEKIKQIVEFITAIKKQIVPPPDETKETMDQVKEEES